MTSTCGWLAGIFYLVSHSVSGIKMEGGSVQYDNNTKHCLCRIKISQQGWQIAYRQYHFGFTKRRTKLELC